MVSIYSLSGVCAAAGFNTNAREMGAEGDVEPCLWCNRIARKYSKCGIPSEAQSTDSDDTSSTLLLALGA